MVLFTLSELNLPCNQPFSVSILQGIKIKAAADCTPVKMKGIIPNLKVEDSSSREIIQAKETFFFQINPP